MGLKTRLSSYCTKRAHNGVDLVTSRKINTRLARPIGDGPSAKTKISDHRTLKTRTLLIVGFGRWLSLIVDQLQLLDMLSSLPREQTQTRTINAEALIQSAKITATTIANI